MQNCLSDSDDRSIEQTVDRRARVLARASCERLMAGALRNYGPARFACVGTLDGHLIAAYDVASAFDVGRLAAYTSSFLALGDAYAREALQGDCGFSTITVGDSAIVTAKVASRHRVYALSLGADNTQVLAMTLRLTLDLAKKLAMVLDECQPL